MKAIIYRRITEPEILVEKKLREEFETYPVLSAFYGTGTPLKKIDTISLRFTKADDVDISPIRIEGTAEEFEKLIKEIEEAIRVNRKWFGVKWKNLPNEL